MYQDAEEAYEGALAAYPDDNDEYAGIGTVKKKLAKCKEEAELHGASIKIQSVFRKKKASAYVSQKKIEAQKEAERWAALTPEEQADEREAKRLMKMSERDRLEEAAAKDRAAHAAENPMANIGQVEVEKTAAQVMVVTILDHSAWMYLTIFNTTYALFAQDIALWLMPKSADYAIAFITFLVFLCFLFEFVGNLYGGREYGAKVHAHEKMDMFFWLDMIGTFSLIPDFLIVFTGEEMDVPDYVILARVARAARIGARLSRLTKLFRIAAHHEKEDPYAKLREEHEAEMADVEKVHNGEDIELSPTAAEVEEEAMEKDMSSEIGDKVTEGISKRVIALVIILLVFVPIFTYQEPRGGIRKTKSDMIHMAHSMKRMDPGLTDPGKCQQTLLGEGEWSDWECFCTDADGTISADQDCDLVTHYKQSLSQLLSYQGDHVIYMTWDRDLPGYKPCAKKPPEDEMDPSGDGSWFYRPGVKCCESWSCLDEARTHGIEQLAPAFVYNKNIFDELRKAEIRKYGDDDLDPHQEPVPDSYEFFRIEMWIDYRQKTQDEAFMNIIYMLVVSVIFALASLVFMMDLNHLVIEPTENMSGAMRMVSARLMDLGGEVGPDGEAAYIESSITKIVSLLNVSFGAAGTRIVSANMSAGSSELQPLVPGAKVSGIYGFCDIREFTASTEALRERIVLFVNEFGSITHTNCIQTGGAPNKNVGDAFLCCWLDNDKDPPMADESLTCYRRAIQDIRTSELLAEICQDRSIAERFPPNKQEFGQYYARMGIGLHYGDAIEGAIGTARKLDASYLGPDVELADVLEATTKIYKTPILMTEMFYMLLSENWQQTCRKVDKVRWDEGEPFWLYAANVKCDASGNYFNPEVVEDVYELEIDESMERDLKFGKVDGAEDPRENDQRWRLFVDEWNVSFEAALQLYVDGKWPEAKAALVRPPPPSAVHRKRAGSLVRGVSHSRTPTTLLHLQLMSACCAVSADAAAVQEECMVEKPYDGPSKKLLQYMKENSVSEWKGYAPI
jgi:class 3 adenylate cyclase